MPRSGIETKPAWASVPVDVRDRIAGMLGARILRASRVYGGYAPSATFHLALADGREVFLKGTYPLPEGSRIHWSLDREERIYRRLGRRVHPWAPELLGSMRHAGWHFIALEYVRGERVLPWTVSRTRRATRSYAAFHRSTHGRPLPAWLSRTEYRPFGVFWRRIGRDDVSNARIAALAGRSEQAARRWLDRAAPELRRAEARLARVALPHALLQFDTRSDNVVLQGDLLRMFDWPFASVGPHEFDFAAFAQAITAEGGPEPERISAWYEDVLPLRPRALIASVAGIAGYFADRAPRPDMPELPRLRSIQRRQLKASLGWAARLLALPDPAWLEAVPD